MCFTYICLLRWPSTISNFPKRLCWINKEHVCMFKNQKEAQVFLYHCISEGTLSLAKCFRFILHVICTVAERALNALQLQKTHANRKSTSKSRKHLHQFDSRWCKCSQTHKYIWFAARIFFGCVESICSVCVVKLRKGFSSFAGVFSICSALSSLGHRIYVW